MGTMRLHLENATAGDAAAIAALRLAVARQLTTTFGHGSWSLATDTEAGVRADIMGSRVMVARESGNVIATLRLSARSPYLREIAAFTPVFRALYLTSMAVSPKRQRHGVGRACLAEVKRIAMGWPCDALRLDAYDAAAGAGDFYRKCGFQEVSRELYNGTPLVFFEQVFAEYHAQTTFSPAGSTAGMPDDIA